MVLELTVVAGWEAWCGSVRELHDDAERWESRLNEQFDQLDYLRESLAARERELARRQGALEADQFELEEERQRLEELRHATDESVRQVQAEAQRLAQARAELASQRIQGDSDGRMSKGGHPSKQWLRERALIEQELHQAQEQLARMAPLAIDLADARQELADARRTIMQQQQRLALAKGHFNHVGCENRREHELERQRLSAALDTAERTIRELRERAQHEQKQMSAERAAWPVELQKLRQALEHHAELLGVGPGGVSPAVIPSGGDLDPALEAMLGRLRDLHQALAPREADPVEAKPAPREERRRSGRRG